jgi:hypothetical protein
MFIYTDVKATRIRKLRGALIAVSVVIMAAGCFFWLRWSKGVPPSKMMATMPAGSNTLAIASSRKAAQGSTVVIQTGYERMSNAAHCMAYVMDLVNKLPKERAGIKTQLAATAGAMFFDDCLMAKRSPKGYITITTNELRQSFSDAVAQLYASNVPPALAEELNRPLRSPPQSQQDIYEREKRLQENLDLSLAYGFLGGFSDRNNMQISVDEQYQRMAQIPELARTLKTLKTAFQQAGITDAEQSDLKQMCLGLGSTRTIAYLMWGPQSEFPNPGQYQALAETLDKALKWRLVNMYGIDDATAQALAQSVSRVPVTGFSHAGLQPPAFIQ